MFRQINLCWLLTCTLSLYGLVWAQPVTPRFETLSVNEGLSQSSVYSILQDRTGFMWFGTSDGLNRFDGETVKVFKAKNPPMSFANSNFIRGMICEDKRGRIWYANETGIYNYNPITEEVTKSFDLLPKAVDELADHVALLIDHTETLWLSVATKGLARYSISTGKFQLIPFPFPISDFDYSMYEPAGNFIWITFPKLNGAIRFDVLTEKYERFFTEFRALSVKVAKGKLFLVEGNQIHIYDSTSQNITTLPFTAESDIRSVLQGSFDRIWIGTTSSGLYCYFPETGRFVSYRSDKSKSRGFPFDFTTSLVIDNRNNLWIGTDGAGVTRLDIKPPRFHSFPLNESDYGFMKDYFIRAIYEDGRGRIWFGTLHSGLIIFDPATNEIVNYSNHQSKTNRILHNTVSAIFRDDQGKMWITRGGEITIFDEHQKVFHPITVQGGIQPDFNFHQITQLPGGDLLAGGSLGVIRIKKYASGNYEGTHVVSIPYGVTHMMPTPSGIWFTSPIHGLYYAEFEDEHFAVKKNFFSGIDIRSLRFDEQSHETLWVCTGAGLIRFNTLTEEYTLYNEDHGMLGSYVYGVLEDDHHNLWMSTNTGLSHLNRTTGLIKNFTFKDGLQSNEFNTGAFHKGSSGTLYFGGINGFNWFKTGAENYESPPPRVLVTSIQVNDKSISKHSALSATGQLELEHFTNDLTIDLAVLDFTRPEANSIRYRLEGWDNNWVVTFTKSVRYSNLPPGMYSFRVSASNGGDKWGDEEIISIFIKAPFWRTEFFYATLGVILVGGIIGVTRMVARKKLSKKLRELEKLHAVMQERERIRKDIHDDLGSGLSKIAILSELARQNTVQDDFTFRQLEKISESSRELIDNLGELIWSNNPANDNLPRLCWYLREHLGAMFDGTNMKFSVELPTFIPEVQVQADWRRNVFLIIKEALHNALKHANATEVVVLVDVKKNMLDVVIQDNGCGFPVEQMTASGNGLSNMNLRVGACQGKLNITSRPGMGTRVKLEVPVGK